MREGDPCRYRFTGSRNEYKIIEIGSNSDRKNTSPVCTHPVQIIGSTYKQIIYFERIRNDKGGRK